jgi:hypothetical protein
VATSVAYLAAESVWNPTIAQSVATPCNRDFCLSGIAMVPDWFPRTGQSRDLWPFITAPYSWPVKSRLASQMGQILLAIIKSRFLLGVSGQLGSGSEGAILARLSCRGMACSTCCHLAVARLEPRRLHPVALCPARGELPAKSCLALQGQNLFVWHDIRKPLFGQTKKMIIICIIQKNDHYLYYIYNTKIT